MTFTHAALLASWVAIAVLTLGLAGMLRQVNQLSRVLAVSGRPTGPAQSRASLEGLVLPETGMLREVAPRGRPRLLVFVSPGCRSCAALLGGLATWAGEDERAAGGDPEVVVVSSGPCQGLPAPAHARCVPDAMPVLERLQVPGTPYLLRVGADGVIGAGLLASNLAEARAFVASSQTRAPATERSAPIRTGGRRS